MINPNIKILQHNLGRCMIANDQLLHYSQANMVDIALLQEPYTRRGILSGLEAFPHRIQLSPPELRPGAHAPVHGAAIVVFNPSLKVLARHELSSANFAVASLEVSTGVSILLIAAYFKFRFPVERHLAELGKILDGHQGDVIIGADVNAHSTMWFNRRNDAKGLAVAHFIHSNGLTCLNVDSRIPTFRGPRGQSFIDVTLSSGTIANRINDWRVSSGVTNSDHAVITFLLEAASRPIFHSKCPRFNLRRADWASFGNHLGQNIINMSISDVNTGALALNNAIKEAALASIPLGSSKDTLRPPWWSKELETKRRLLKLASRNRFDSRGGLSASYRRARNEFTAQLRSEKLKSWRAFCSREGSSPWGKLFKWAKKGSRSCPYPSALRKLDGTYSSSCDETASLLLDSLIPNDKNVAPLVAATVAPSGPFDLTPVTLEELKEAVWRQSPNKAPGQDGLTGGIIRQAWPHIKYLLLALVENCLSGGIFPDCWKSAEVVPILKKPTNDPAVCKSYRPISLLPTLGKVLERIICSRLLTTLQPVLSGRQFGFTKHKSTYSAMENLTKWHGTRIEKHSLVVLLDITGAFDNLNWELLFHDLSRLGCSEGLCTITKSYLCNRTASLTLGGSTCTVKLTRGCPQGSIFGPVLWNVSMERLLLSNFPIYSAIQAYADDIAVSVAANSRRELQLRSSNALAIVHDWGTQRDLTFSCAKSVAVLIKSNLVPGFTVDFGPNSITTSSQASYLGVTIDQGLSFRPHVSSLKQKDISLFTRLRSALGRGWGMDRRNADILYRCVFLPKVMYGYQLWASASTHWSTIKALNVVQRLPLMGISSAYRTASTNSLQVITGHFPLDIEVQLMAALAQAKLLPALERDTAIDTARKKAVRDWQYRWSNSSKSRWTFKWFPDIETRLKTPLWLGHELVQFFTGHGDFYAKLAQLGLSERADCACGYHSETAEHILYRCPRVNTQRERLELAVLRAGYLWPCEPRILLTSRALFSALDAFCISSLRDRSDR